MNRSVTIYFSVNTTKSLKLLLKKKLMYQFNAISLKYMKKKKNIKSQIHFLDQGVIKSTDKGGKKTKDNQRIAADQIKN